MGPLWSMVSRPAGEGAAGRPRSSFCEIPIRSNTNSNLECPVTTVEINEENGVNGTIVEHGVASGRGRCSRASQIVILRNPYGVIRIATWNVRSLVSPGKLENIKREMDRNKINVLGMTEVRWKGCGEVKDENYTAIYTLEVNKAKEELLWS